MADLYASSPGRQGAALAGCVGPWVVQERARAPLPVGGVDGEQITTTVAGVLLPPELRGRRTPRAPAPTDHAPLRPVVCRHLTWVGIHGGRLFVLGAACELGYPIEPAWAELRDRASFADPAPE